MSADEEGEGRVAKGNKAGGGEQVEGGSVVGWLGLLMIGGGGGGGGGHCSWLLVACCWGEGHTTTRLYR